MDQKKIGEFIALLRKERGITQAELGEKIGVTNKTISRWENGNYMPDISTMMSLCNEFKINMNELLSGQRLDNDEFRVKADDNVIDSLKREKNVWKKKKLMDFLEGGGTGILVSIIFSPNTPRRTAVFIIGLVMLCAGRYYRSKYEQYILQRTEDKNS
ncbi:helix-turn-helix domain-containing protein [Anaerostipes sp.]|uniref:helix-turn-helix domain-containing protein n=1 Tax=Anaerostipes sp. TaxID=1872530 RepID=UPI0025C242EB|nr:helix-turn-helix transcriptional regulator [Anaerostipes sp.]